MGGVVSEWAGINEWVGCVDDTFMGSWDGMDNLRHFWRSMN